MFFIIYGTPADSSFSHFILLFFVYPGIIITLFCTLKFSSFSSVTNKGLYNLAKIVDLVEIGPINSKLFSNFIAYMKTNPGKKHRLGKLSLNYWFTHRKKLAGERQTKGKSLEQLSLLFSYEKLGKRDEKMMMRTRTTILLHQCLFRCSFHLKWLLLLLLLGWWKSAILTRFLRVFVFVSSVQLS